MSERATRRLSLEHLEPRQMLDANPLEPSAVDTLLTDIAQDIASSVTARTGEGEAPSITPSISLVASTPVTGPSATAAGFSQEQGRNTPIDTKDNVAYQGNGALPAVTSSPLQGYAIHQPHLLNDGRIGNGSSFIASTPNGWAKIDVGALKMIDRVRLGRDRTGWYADRDPGRIIVAVATSENAYAPNDGSADAEEYVTVFDSASTAFNGNFNPGETWEITFPPVAARYVKVSLEKSGACLDEIEVREAPTPPVQEEVDPEQTVPDAEATDAAVTELMNEDGASQEQDTAAPEQPATAEEIGTLIATHMTDHLAELERAALLRDIASALQQYPALVSRRDAAKAALDLWNAQSWYQRAGHGATAIRTLPVSKLSPADQADVRLYDGAYRYAFAYLDAKKTNNKAEMSNQMNGLDQYLNYFKMRGTWEYNEAQKYGLYIPRATTVVGEAATLRTKQATIRQAAIDTEARATSNSDNRAEWERRLSENDLQLLRQRDALTGGWEQSTHIVRTTLEAMLTEGLHLEASQMPAELHIERVRTGSRVMRNDAGSLSIDLTDREYQDLCAEFSAAIATTDGSPAAVRLAVEQALADNPVWTEIVARCRTVVERYRQSPVTAEILAEAEQAQEIPYARMFVELTEHADGRVTFTIRMRNPGPSTYILAEGATQLLEHPDGLADGRVQFTLPNNWYYGQVRQLNFCMYTDKSRTAMLDRVVVRYDQKYGRAQVLTQQRAWDDYEEGKLERVPVDPALMVYATHKHNVIVAVRSPADQSVVSWNVGTHLDTMQLSHENGTEYAMATVTFDVARPTGRYVLSLYERPDGLLQDTVAFDWNRETQTLTPADPADGAPEIPEGDAAARNVLQYFQTATTMGDSIFYGEQNWQRILHSELIERTRDLPAPYNVTYDFYASFYALHPELREENIQATIDAEWARMGPTWTRKQMQNRVLGRRSDLLKAMNDRCIEYTLALGEILGEAMEGMQGIRMGKDPQTVFNTLQTLWELYANPNRQNGHGYRADCVAAIHELTGITLPTPAQAITIAERLIDRVMVRLQSMVLDHDATVRNLAENGYHLNGDGNWVPNSTYVPTDLPPDMDALSRTATRFSRWFGTEVAMADPRLEIIAQNDGAQKVVLATLDQYITKVQLVASLNSIFDVAFSTTVEFTSDGADLLDGVDIDETMSFIDLRLILKKYDDAALLDVTQSWYKRASGTMQYPTYGSESVRDDTVAGRIFNGLMQQAQTKRGVELRLLFCIAERIIGIRPYTLYTLAKNGDLDGFFAALRQQFTDGGHGELFVQQSLCTAQDTRVLSVATDKSAYTDADSSMRIDFDLSGADTSFSQWNAYLADTQGNPFPSAPALLEQNVTGSLSATIPLSRISEVLSQSFTQGTFTIRLAVWQRPTDTQGLPGNRISAPFTVTMHPRSTEGGTEEGTVTLQHLSDDPVENAVLNEMAAHFPLEGNAAEWRWVIGSDAHVGDDFHAIDLNWGNGDADYGKLVKAPADGVIEKIGLSFGSVRIAHSQMIAGQIHPWFSSLLHMPIYLTDRVSENGKPIYEVRQENGAVVLELFEGMQVNAQQTMGIVAGRGPEGNDHFYRAHSHLEVEINGRTVDLRTLAQAWGIVNITADDFGSAGELPVQWNEMENRWMNSTYGLALDRSAQEGDEYATVSWIAWHADPEQRERVVWQKAKYLDDSGQLHDEGTWIVVSNGQLRWNGADYVPILMQ